MNNKKLGSAFEKDFCKVLADEGWWVHFLNPNTSGAQPFDIIAIKDSVVATLDCKTCATDSFSLSRIEDNQWLAFSNLVWKTNAVCGFIVSHDDKLYFISFSDAKNALDHGQKSIKLDDKHLLGGFLL